MRHTPELVPGWMGIRWVHSYAIRFSIPGASARVHELSYCSAMDETIFNPREHAGEIKREKGRMHVHRVPTPEQVPGRVSPSSARSWSPTGFNPQANAGAHELSLCRLPTSASFNPRANAGVHEQPQRCDLERPHFHPRANAGGHDVSLDWTRRFSDFNPPS